MEQIGFHDMRSLLQKSASAQQLTRLERMLTMAHRDVPDRVRDEWWPYASSIISRNWPEGLKQRPLAHALTGYSWPGVDAVLGSFREIDARASGRAGHSRLLATESGWRADLIALLDALPEEARDQEGLVSAILKEIEDAKKSAIPGWVRILGAMGQLAASARESLSILAQSKDKKTRKAAFDAIGEVGGDVEFWSELLVEALLKGDKLVAPAFANLSTEAGEIILAALTDGSAKVERACYEAMVYHAPHMERGVWDEHVLDVLEHDKEPIQKLGLAIVNGMERPPVELLESVADLSSYPGASSALRKFDFEPLRAELPSLVSSGLAEERLVGLEILRHHGARAAEFIPRVSALVNAGGDVETTISALHLLARIVDEGDVAATFTPALDHWSEEVREVAQGYLQEANVPVRGSKWEGHPFSQSLLRQLIRLGFEPKEGIFEAIPEARPMPELKLDIEDQGWPEGWSEVNMSKAVWALLNALEQPPYELYTVWGSNENMDTFYFSSESTLMGRDGADGEPAPMYVIGDGSIGYYAALDLRDESDDPSLYYIERWSGWGMDGCWRASYGLSRYLRQLGSRR